MERKLRFVLVASGLLALTAALWAGLIRMGWSIPPLVQNLPMLHGPLMINSFLGLVIGLERAVALSSKGVQKPILWPYLSPLFIALGTLVLFIPAQGLMQYGVMLITAGSLVLVAAVMVIIWTHTVLYTLTMGLGALGWLIGNIFWMAGQPIFTLVLWWMAFPLFTVIGERLELSRILRLSRLSHVLFGLACAIFLLGTVISVFNLDLGMRIAGVGEIACALWLLRYDIARRTVRKAGMPRFVALCLLSGYGWLGVSGVLNAWFGVTYAGLHYDAALHSLFVGFVFSMIFGHAPIILPAVLDLPVNFNNRQYVALFLLHLSLVLRIIGDLTTQIAVRQWGGMFNVIALLVFLGTMAAIVMVARHERSTIPTDNKISHSV